jgi:hypothetical protein
MAKNTIQPDQTDAAADMAGDSPLIAKLKKQKAKKAGESHTTLPETGIVVTWPKFQSHGAWMKAMRLARKDFAKATNFYLTGICTFDGEKMTVTDFVALIPSNDIFHLSNAVMGQEDDAGDAQQDDEEDAGNALH